MAKSSVLLASSHTHAQQQSGQRLLSPDIVRGYAMLAMLISHSAWWIEGLTYRVAYGWDNLIVPAMDKPQSVVGLILQMASPTFFLLAGIGMALLVASRQRRGDDASITRYFLVRGALLIGLDLLAMNVTLIPLAYYTRLSVLTTMGLALWAMALLRRLPSRALLALALGLLLFTQTFYALAGIPQDDLFLRALLLAPKVTDAWSVEFPLLAWMPVVLLGFVIGRQIKRPDFSLHRLSASVGMILISAAGLVILLNGFGNLYTERRIILGKHPPDFAYLALYTGIALLLIAFHTRFPTLTAHWLLRWVAALGQAALVFYVLHVKVLEALAWALAPLELPPAGLSLLLVTMTLALLLPVCVVYRHAKRLYPHSPLQYL